MRPITHKINLSLTQAAVSSAWKVATVTPIYKSGDNTDPGNYRPISILPGISTITEKWVANLLIKHLNQGSTLLHPTQFGFRGHHSTKTAVKTKYLLDRYTCVRAVFLYLKRAFDTVNHEVLRSR